MTEPTDYPPAVSTPDRSSHGGGGLIHDTGLDVVTGAFSYSGRAIADALQASGRTVRTSPGTRTGPRRRHRSRRGR